jgi:hypothetical protein
MQHAAIQRQAAHAGHIAAIALGVPALAGV